MIEYRRALADMKELLLKIDEVQCEDNVTEEVLSYAIQIFEDIVSLKKQSKYYKEFHPNNIQITTTSQCRMVTLDSSHKADLKQDIEAAGIETPILTFQSAPQDRVSPTLGNGNHRLVIMLELIKERKLGSGAKMPCFHIPYDDYKVIAPIIDLIQGLLNEHTVAKKNNDKSLKAIIKSLLPKDIDLENEVQYNQQVTRFSSMWTRRKVRTIKTLLTKIKNDKISSESKLTSPSPKVVTTDFKACMLNRINITSDGDKEENKFRASFKKKTGTFDKSADDIYVFRPISLKGSNFDQAYLRDMNLREEGDIKDIVHIFYCNENAGSLPTLIKNRKRLFDKYCKIYNQNVSIVEKVNDCKLTQVQKQRIVRLCLPAAIFIAPQIKTDTQYEDNEVELEITGLYDSWKVVTRDQMFDYFESSTKDGAPLEWVLGLKNKQQAPSLELVA